MVLYPLHVFEISDHIALVSLLVIQSIYTFILFPLSMYYMMQLWKLHKKNVLFISKRRPQIVLFGILLFSLYPVIIRLLMDLPRVWNKASRFDDPYIRMGLGTVVCLFIYGIFARVWLLYYDYERNMAMFDTQWQTHLKKHSSHVPWALKYRNLGNTKIVFVMSIISWLLAIGSVQLTAHFVGIYAAERAQLQYVAVIPPILAAIIIAFKIRKWNDTLYLKRELQLMAFMTLIAYVAYMCTAYPFLDYYWNIRTIFDNVFVCVWCYALAFISSKWVISKYKIYSLITATNNELSLEEVLCDDIGFKLFAEYLVQEYSIEHLCFLFEIMKLKHELIAAKIITRKEAGILICLNYTDKSNKISVLDMQSIGDTMKYIVDKYINAESEQSINISARIRASIFKLPLKEGRHPLDCTPSDVSMEVRRISKEQVEIIHTTSTTVSLNNTDTFDIAMCLKRFDGAIEQIIKLLTHDSLCRFYESEAYQQIIRNKK
eukprot:157740_1